MSEEYWREKCDTLGRLLDEAEAKLKEQGSRLDSCASETQVLEATLADRDLESVKVYKLLVAIKDDLVLRAGHKANAVDLSATIWNRLCNAIAVMEAE